MIHAHKIGHGCGEEGLRPKGLVMTNGRGSIRVAPQCGKGEKQGVKSRVLSHSAETKPGSELVFWGQINSVKFRYSQSRCSSTH